MSTSTINTSTYPAWTEAHREVTEAAANWPNHLSDTARARIFSAVLDYGQACRDAALPPRPEHKPLADYVAVSTDHDCDGIGTGFHAFTGREGSISEAEAFYCGKNGSVPMGLSDGYVMSHEEFMAKVWPEMDAHDREYWQSEGYHGHFARR